MADCLCQSESYSSPSCMSIAASDMVSTDAHTTNDCVRSSCHSMLMLTWQYAGMHHWYLMVRERNITSLPAT